MIIVGEFGISAGNPWEGIMTDDPKIMSSKFTRRCVVQGVACAAGALPIVLASSESAYAKMSQASVGYRGSPKGNQSCGNCSLFSAPSSCTSVEGPISSNGWCKIWVKK